MVNWRRPNKRRPREMQPYLGDVPDGLEPTRRPYRMQTEGPRWLERGVFGIIAIFGGAIFSAFVLAAIILALMTVARAEVQTIKPPRACVKLAKQFNATLPETFTRAEAQHALDNLGVQMILNAQARACRTAIKMELKR